jgi:hypothetical protein
MMSNAQLLDQQLEDLAGEEVGEFANDYALDAEYSQFTEIDEFADIDLCH